MNILTSFNGLKQSEILLHSVAQIASSAGEQPAVLAAIVRREDQLLTQGDEFRGKAQNILAIPKLITWVGTDYFTREIIC